MRSSIVALGAAGAVALAGLAGCGGSSTSGTPIDSAKSHRDCERADSSGLTPQQNVDLCNCLIQEAKAQGYTTSEVFTKQASSDKVKAISQDCGTKVGQPGAGPSTGTSGASGASGASSPGTSGGPATSSGASSGSTDTSGGSTDSSGGTTT